MQFKFERAAAARCQHQWCQQLAGWEAGASSFRFVILTFHSFVRGNATEGNERTPASRRPGARSCCWGSPELPTQGSAQCVRASSARLLFSFGDPLGRPMEDSLPSDGVMLIESPSHGSLSDGESNDEHEDVEDSGRVPEPQRRGAPWSGVAGGWAGAGLRREHSRESIETELSTVLEEGSNEQVSLGSNVATSILTELVDSAVSRVQALEPEPEPEQEARHRDESPDLQEWLVELGAAEYYQRFIQEGFEDLASVLQSRLTEDDLRELGMVAMVSTVMHGVRQPV